MIHQVIISSVIFILCTVAAILTCAKKRKEKLQATPGDLTVTNYDLEAVEKSLLPENDDFQELLKIPSVDGNCTSQKQWKSVLSPSAESPTKTHCNWSPKRYSMPGSERLNNSWTSRKNGKLERNELSKNRELSNGNGQDKSRVNGSTITKTVSENSSSVMGFRIYNAEFLSRYNHLFGYKRNRVGKGPAKCGGGGGDENCSRSAASEDSSFFRRLYFYRGNDSSTFTTPSAERRRSKSARMHRKPSINIEDTVPKHRRDYQTLYIVEDDAMVRSDHKQ